MEFFFLHFPPKFFAIFDGFSKCPPPTFKIHQIWQKMTEGNEENSCSTVGFWYPKTRFSGITRHITTTTYSPSMWSRVVLWYSSITDIMGETSHRRFVVVISVIQIAVAILFCFFVRYKDDLDLT